MKPLIGVTSSMEISEENYYVNADNIAAITISGGNPVILPNLSDENMVMQIATTIDGLYVTGGYDIDPTLFGEEPHPNLGIIIPSRDVYEIQLIKQMINLNKPVLAICRGCQILNVAMGGDMYQDIYAQNNHDLLQHEQKAPKSHGSHFISIEKDSLLYQLTGVLKMKVNSFHHQANRKIGSSLKVSGKANDGIIEAIESTKHPFVLGLQWHPEKMVNNEEDFSLKIYQSFVKTCKLFPGK